MLSEIVEEQQRVKQVMAGKLPGNEKGVRILIKVPNNMVGLVIGKGGETIRYIAEKTGAIVYMPKDEEDYTNPHEKTLICTGTIDQAEAARKEIQCNHRGMTPKALS